MIERSEKAQAKFAEGTAQFTLQKNRIKALQIALQLLNLKGDNNHSFTQEEFENAQAPLLSLINKSEKAQIKLKAGSWQYNMLKKNIMALQMAMPLLTEKLKKSNH